MNYPKTKEEYWQLVEDNWKDIERLIYGFHPAYNQDLSSVPITAPDAESMCEQIREEIREHTKEDPIKKAKQLFADRSPEFPSLMNQVWFGIPESIDCHSYPGFSVLCDLCSEADVLYDEDWEGFEEM